ncbi:MerR family transcriptional regulator [Desulfoluna limicola]|uniref:MerR family transcriptional regulator n=1 Tax=Desulfoluna limicola TaxID=2810562 RepID=A0ABN6EXH4_9BACT|nr:MerR family transcriptional regulator [Desulfoluna limicola]BCS95063.1 MerR family transcriptional regulator [Desulfoluna limicola]
MASEQKTLTISELASSLELSPSTIRYYEEKGLISPTRTPGNQRVYTAKDRARLKLILRGKRFGCSLEEIAEIIGLASTEVSEVGQIEKSLAYAERKIEEVQERKLELDLMEKDIRAMKEALELRLQELKE